jgi:hypothetical protein
VSRCREILVPGERMVLMSPYFNRAETLDPEDWPDITRKCLACVIEAGKRLVHLARTVDACPGALVTAWGELCDGSDDEALEDWSLDAAERSGRFRNRNGPGGEIYQRGDGWRMMMSKKRKPDPFRDGLYPIQLQPMQQGATRRSSLRQSAGASPPLFDHEWLRIDSDRPKRTARA